MKTVLITGAGRGLGRATANAYHKNGFFVIATDVNKNLLDDLKHEDNYLPLELNVASEQSVSKCSEQILKDGYQIDILISNAGIFDFYPVSESGSELLSKIFSVNVLGLVNLTKYFSSHLVLSKGRLIVVGSESYKVPSPFQPYSVSKQALESIYNAVKIELSLKGVKSILIRPGAMKTQILEDTIHFNNKNIESLYRDEFSGFLETVPKYIGKIISPKKVADIILKAGTSKHPKRIYSVNHNPIVSLLSVIPKGMQYRIIKKSLEK